MGSIHIKVQINTYVYKHVYIFFFKSIKMCMAILMITIIYNLHMNNINPSRAVIQKILNISYMFF